MLRIVLVVVALAYTGGVLYLSWTPTAAHTGSETAVIIKRWLFNLLHPPVYAGMMLAWYGVMSPRRVWRWRAALGAAGIATAVGVVGEIGQIWVPGRFPDWLDGTFNFAGAGLGMWIMHHVTAKRWTRRSVNEGAVS